MEILLLKVHLDLTIPFSSKDYPNKKRFEEFVQLVQNEPDFVEELFFANTDNFEEYIVNEPIFEAELVEVKSTNAQ